MSALSIRGWAGPGQDRLDVRVAAGECREVEVSDPDELARRAAGLARPLLWLRLGEQDVGRLTPVARARAGLATVTGLLPHAAELTVLDVLLLGRPLPGPFGIRGLTGQQRGEPSAQREAAARALAGRLGLGPMLDDPLAGLDGRQAAVVDLGRALLGEPRAVVAVLPRDIEAASWFRRRLADEVAIRGCPALLLAPLGPPGRHAPDRLPTP